MAPGVQDPRMPSVQPRLKYNTIGGINGPLVILDNVRLSALSHPDLQICRSSNQRMVE